VAEDFTFEQLSRNGGAVHFHEDVRRSLALGMNGTCDQFFAGACLSFDKDCGVRLSHGSNLI
jgi:hypothetical protein